MSGLPLEFLPGAVVDAQEAHAWYFERDEKTAAAFMAELDAAVESIIESPDRWPTWIHGTHRHLLHRFPFFIVYRIRDTTIWVVAVAHARQRPDYWRRR